MDAAKATISNPSLSYHRDQGDETFAELVRGATDEALEKVSHYATEPAAKKLEKSEPGLAARSGVPKECAS